MTVSAASRMFSASSFGVFCRFAPSTSAIIRSMKVSPGLGGDLHDDPVGQHLGAAGDRGAVPAGLPDDRGGLAGDGRLVHRGDALDDVAVTGDDLARLDDHEVAEGELGAGHLFLADSAWPGCQPVSRRATVSRLVRRSVSACALPRPSATASARLANTTVSQSQTTIVQLKTDEWAMAVPVVSTAPTSTTNMTGFLS